MKIRAHRRHRFAILLATGHLPRDKFAPLKKFRNTPAHVTRGLILPAKQMPAKDFASRFTSQEKQKGIFSGKDALSQRFRAKEFNVYFLPCFSAALQCPLQTSVALRNHEHLSPYDLPFLSP
jgi:hypothetical protein